ncbi:MULTISPECIES: non-ribosomal peptide synthetase [unclassified Paenibacillus]
MTSFDPQDSRLSKLSDAKLALLSKRMNRGEHEPRRSRIMQRAAGGPAPLSSAQTGMWFMSQYDSLSSEYNMCAAVKMTGNLQIASLQESLSAIARRHAALRTSFIELNGEPQQVMASEISIPLEIIDLRGEEEDYGEETALRAAKADAQQPFDLSEAPLLRTKLFHVSRNTLIFYINMHHIISDGWSKGLLIQEIMSCYKSLVDQVAVSLPELPVQYADYAWWEQEWLQSEGYRKQLEYWKNHLQSPHPVLQLPMERKSPLVPATEGDICSFEIPAVLTAKLREFGTNEGATLFMTLLSAFKALLFRYTGQENLLIGTPVANRNHSETANLIGCFVNSLVIRSQLSAASTFRELVREIKHTCLNAFSNQEVPFEKVLQELHVSRSAGVSPLFQAVFTLQNTPKQNLELPGLTLEYMNLHNDTAKYNLVLSVEEEGSVLQGTLEYRIGLFDPEDMERMADHLLNMMKSAVESPDIPISRLSIMSGAELERTIKEYSGGASEAQLQHHNLVEWFEQQASHTPDHIALTFNETELTYRELNEQANRVAHYLLQSGIQAEQFIGLYIERSIEMIVGLIGILKAGGAYVPLDPALPADRLSYMLRDSGLQTIITSNGLSTSLSAYQGAWIELDGPGMLLSGKPTGNPNCTILSGHLAYMIYTSGSTGQPKGVMVEHGNAVRLFETTQSYFTFNEKDVWTLFHSYAFDFSVWEIWGALLYGGRLVIVPYWISRSPEDFYRTLLQEQVTVLNQTPSAFRQLLKAEESAFPGTELALRYIVFGGEALDMDSLKPWFQRHGEHAVQLVNMYGITETTVHTTLYPISSLDTKTHSGSIIGRPLGDLSIYVLNEHLQPVPVGIPGEMYVGGAGVTRGYWKKAELTADRFIPHPYVHGERLYKTGDLARFQSGGNLEYIGRIDHQVKINGFRIELGEIEAVLKQVPEIGEGVVTIREEQGLSVLKRLEAYLVKKPGRELNLQAIRVYLGQKLPNYMIPAAFYELDTIPLTHNGKADLKAILSMNVQQVDGDSRFSAPRTGEEQQLCSIWQKVLSVDSIGIDDNFFELGGDSIRAIRVRAEAQQLGILFTIQQLFELQTIRMLAEALKPEVQILPEGTTRTAFHGLNESDRSKMPDSVIDAYPLSRLQSGMLFHSVLHPNGSSIYHNITSITLEGQLEFAALDRAVQKVVSKHRVLRTSFDLTSYSVPLQLVHGWAQAEVNMDDLRGMSTREQEAALNSWHETERRTSFDWTSFPLFRIHIHLLTEDTFQFTLTEHHAILDGWSVASMLTELFGYYNDYIWQREPMQETALSIEYSNYVELEQLTLEDEGTRRFWEKYLSEAAYNRLPGATGTGNNGLREIAMDSAEYTVPAELFDGARQLAAMASVPLKSVLLASHLYVLRTLCNEPDLVTGLVANCRPEELSGDQVLGLFLNTLPLRLQLKDINWLELVKITFKTEMEVWPHRRLPLDEIQKIAAEGQPLFDSVFNFTDFHIYQSFAGAQNLSVLNAADIAYTNFDWMTQFNLDARSSELKLILQWNTSRFSKEQMVQFKEYYLRTLESMTQEPLIRYSAFTPLPADERRKVLTEWNATQCEYELDKPLIRWIEEQAERTPDAMAVRFEGRELTYSELNRQAEQLARRLRRMGAGPDRFVGISVERSLEMMVGLLGILKSRAAYVPLDPTYPRERLAFMLQDAGVPILLTQSHLAAGLPEHAAQIVLLDGPKSAPPEEIVEEEPVKSAAGPKNAVYMIYTSGSTGTPKGVINIQEAVVNRLLWMQDTFRLTPEDRVMQKTPISFDVSVWELFWPLMTGAGLIIAAPEGHKDPDYLLRLIRKEQVTTLHFVPSMLQMFVEQPGVENTASLKRVICSGEALPYELQERYFTQVGAELWNLYGPTEAAIDVTFWKCSPGTGTSNIPIGYPVANTQMYVLNRELQPVPAGVTGDLYIGGVQLARGYHGRPDLTNERFLPDPFRKDTGSRIYKTGDLARYGPDGRLEYAGRSDDQIKLRGFRIELGEIEAAMLKHSEVVESAVVVREDGRAGKRLIGYWTSKKPGRVSGAELRSFLKEELPEYMVPAAWVEVEAMPLTPSGKTDRRQLPMPQESRSELATGYVPPSTEAERKLADIWQDVLGVDRVGVNDNFFTLGGDSIRSISVLSKASTAGIFFTLQQLFEFPMISALLNQIGANTAQITEVRSVEPFALLTPADAVKLKSLGVEDAYPLTVLQAGLVYHSKLYPNTALYHDIMSFTIKGRFDEEAFKQAIQNLSARHSILRTTFDLSSYSEPVQLVHLQIDEALIIIDLSKVSEAERKEALHRFKESERQLQFDWSKPLVRFFVHVLGDDKYCATLSFHDSMLDGWSVNALIAELFTDYIKRINGSATSIRASAVPFREYVALERQAAATEGDKQFWLDALEGMTFSPVPRITSSPDVAGRFTIRYWKVDIPQHVSDKLVQLAEEMGVPLKSILLAVHMRVMGLLGGTEDVLTGLEHNGRPEANQAESMLGLFLNTIPFRLNLNVEEDSWESLIRETFRTETTLLPYRRYPMAHIQRDQGGQPLFETVFNYTHFHVAEKLLRLPELELTDMDTVLETDFPLRAEFSRDIATGHVRFELHYNACILSERLVGEVAGYYQKAFDCLLSNRHARYLHQDLLSEEEKELLLYRWNQNNASKDPSLPDVSFPQLFEERAANWSNRIAASDRDQSISYFELNTRSNKAARELIAKGAGPGVCIAVLGQRNLNFLITLIAVLKSGGVYVPLDPHYPEERIADMVDISCSRLVITSDEYSEPFERMMETRNSDQLCEIVTMTELLQAEHATDSPGMYPGKDQLAYIIFTSGSTGRPKGAMVEHKGMMNHLYAKITDLQLTEGDRIAQNASQCFDISVWQFLSGLLVGGSVHICEDELVYNAAAMLQVIERKEITILEMVPSVIRTMLDQTDRMDKAPELPYLRWMIPTGEALPPDLVRQWFGQYSHIPMMNAYGPTECSDDVTHYPIYEEPANPWSIVPIGLPVRGMAMYVLDSHLRPVPLGVPGELYVGGVGVGRGYVGNPEKTSEVFLDNRFDTSLGSRLYKTGDLVRYLEDGNLVFLGRVDHQVKIRGHRIEIGEIETVLGRHPGIRESVVVALDKPPHEKYLAGYIVTKPGLKLSAKELRSYLRAQLPDYCIPSYLLFIDAIPLTPNGKVDRKQLPLPNEHQESNDEPVLLPENALQQSIAAVWQDVLQRETVGIDEHFFEIGGDSLRLMQVHSRLEQTLGCTIAIADLFQYPTIKSLAVLLHDSAEQDKRNREELSGTMERVSQRKEKMKKRRQARDPQE